MAVANSRQNSASRHLEKIVARLPDGMREQIKERAGKAGRSTNAEIVQILNEALVSDENGNHEMSDRKFKDQFMLRLPDGMRDGIHEVADANGRSMTQEIVLALQRHLADPDSGLADQRDRFAEAALVGLPGLCAHDTLLDGMTFEQHVARSAYRIADAMMAERERTG